jgi:hypothetical protein
MRNLQEECLPVSYVRMEEIEILGLRGLLETLESEEG